MKKNKWTRLPKDLAVLVPCGLGYASGSPILGMIAVFFSVMCLHVFFEERQ